MPKKIFYNFEGDREFLASWLFKNFSLSDRNRTLQVTPEEDIVFCWAELIPQCGELGITSLAELEALEVPQKIIMGSFTQSFPVRVECESNWKPKTLQECLDKR